MTVDGTLFTTTGALLFLGVNLMELYGNTELTSVAVYYIRLSCAVAEMVIFTVVLFSQIPVFTQHLPVFDRYDSFVMHLVLPILTISSSYVNPLGLVLTEKWQWLLYLFIRLLLALTLMLLLLLLQNSYCKKRRAKRTAAHRTRFR